MIKNTTKVKKLISDLKSYTPFNEQEISDKKIILENLSNTENIFSRLNETVHFTASSWIVNKEKAKVLMVYHNIYDSWSWLGGHADNEQDLLKVALKEAKEESGLERIISLSDEIFSLEILTVDGHEKNGKYISSHLHLNLTYLLQADEQHELIVKPDEIQDIAWFRLDEAVKASSEPWFQKRIYQKLNEKLTQFK